MNWDCLYRGVHTWLFRVSPCLLPALHLLYFFRLRGDDISTEFYQLTFIRCCDILCHIDGCLVVRDHRFEESLIECLTRESFEHTAHIRHTHITHHTLYRLHSRTLHHQSSTHHGYSMFGHSLRHIFPIVIIRIHSPHHPWAHITLWIFMRKMSRITLILIISIVSTHDSPSIGSDDESYSDDNTQKRSPSETTTFPRRATCSTFSAFTRITLAGFARTGLSFFGNHKKKNKK